MYNFDGKYRRTKEQNLAGASRLSAGKDELISRAHQERNKRLVEKKRELSAIRIQKIVRGFLSRLRLKKKLHLEFGEWLGLCENRTAVPSDVQYLIARLHAVNGGSLTKSHLEFVIKKALSISNEIIALASKDNSWIWRINLLLTFVVDALSRETYGIPLNKSVQLMCDALDTFTALNDNSTPTTIKKILWYLLHSNYMLVLRNMLILLDKCHIQLYKDTNLEILRQLPSESVNLVAKLLTRPVRLLEEADDPCYRAIVLETLMRTITYETKICEPIKKHLLNVVKEKTDFPIAEAVDLCLNSDAIFITPAGLYFFLSIDKDQTAILIDDQTNYFQLLSLFTADFAKVHEPYGVIYALKPDEIPNIPDPNYPTFKKAVMECYELINSERRSQVWLYVLNKAMEDRNYTLIHHHTSCISHIIICDPCSLYKCSLLTGLWFLEGWLRNLWVMLESYECFTVTCEEVPSSSLGQLKRGFLPNIKDSNYIVPIITVFSSFLFATLSYLTDEELMKPDLIVHKNVKPFTVNELIYIACTLKDVAVGMIALGYPDIQIAATTLTYYTVPTNIITYNSAIWNQALVECTRVVREINFRNERCQIISSSDFFTFLFPIPENGLQCYVNIHNEIRLQAPYDHRHRRTSNFPERIGTWYDRACSLLTTMPFTVCFGNRYKMFWNVINTEMYEHQNPDIHFLQNIHLSTSIRRDYIYEDSFEKLSLENAPELKIAIRIRFTNLFNIDEAGIDGGGIFREFISELLKTAFDPNRGFFMVTKDNKLYPNPNVAKVYPNFTTHYFFIGRMLAKAIFENIIVNIPLADFFIAKILDRSTLFPSLLHTLDKEMFKNISYLKTFSGDYSTLGLDFSITKTCFGSNEVVELKENGSNIVVDKNNVIEYIHLISKQKLHLDISKQTRAFTKGLGQVLPLHLFRMFTPREIQLIISGNHITIDIDDMKQNVIYSGGYTATHPNIIRFWNVFESFSEQEKGEVLKFVTSCSRPPLRGFQDLHPPFCIHFVEGIDDRLPTSSTCMNILKLPSYNDEENMKEKLLYAIHSGAGFELS